VKLCVGPAPAASARAWTGWAGEVLRALRSEPGTTAALPPPMLASVGSYVELWAGTSATRGDTFRWSVDVDADELEYLTNGLYQVDLRVADQGHRCPVRPEPKEAQAFHVLLVEALLFALAQEGPSRAAFADQLRAAWPVADLTAERGPGQSLQPLAVSGLTKGPTV
jgi:hypothetical protein